MDIAIERFFITSKLIYDYKDANSQHEFGQP